MSITIDNEPMAGEFEYDKDAAEGKAVSIPEEELSAEGCDSYSVNADNLDDSYMCTDDEYSDNEIIENALFFETTTVEGNFVTVSTQCVEAVEEAVHPNCGTVTRVYMSSGAVFEVKDSYKHIVEKL